MSASPRLVCLLALAASAIPLTACGGSSSGRAQADSASSTQPAAASAQATSADSAATSPGFIDPKVQVANVVPSETKLDVWTARLRARWGATPTARWSAVKEADARWRARLVLRGPAKADRISASWLVLLPLDRKPTTAELRSELSKQIRPLDAEARRLSALPPASPTERSVSVETQLEPSGDDTVEVSLAAPDGSGPEIRNGRLDEASLRGALFVRGASNDDVIRLDRPGVRITRDGRALGLDALRTLAFQPSPTTVKITWATVPRRASRAELLRLRPSTVTVLSSTS